MLVAAFRHEHIRYVAGTAEQLPLAPGSCDLATMGSAFHWCERQATFAELERVVRRGGSVAIYDVELTGVSGSPALIGWLRGDYWANLPRCPHNGAFDVRQHVRRPFTIIANGTLRAEAPMTVDELVSFILSQASSINAVTVGAASFDALEARLRDGLAQHIRSGGAAATARFDVPFSMLRKVA